MKPERISEPDPDRILPHTETLSLDKAFALRQVLGHFRLPFRLVANEGAPYPDGGKTVRKGCAYVTYDTGEIPIEVIDRMVEEIAPTPPDGIR